MSVEPSTGKQGAVSSAQGTNQAGERQTSRRGRPRKSQVDTRSHDPSLPPVLNLSDSTFLAVRSGDGSQHIIPWPYGGMDLSVPAFGEIVASVRWRESPIFVAAERRGDIVCREISDPILPQSPPIPENLLLEEEYWNRVAETLAHSHEWRPEYDALVFVEPTSDGRSIFSREFIKTTWATFLRQVLWREINERPEARQDVVDKIKARLQSIEEDRI